MFINRPVLVSFAIGTLLLASAGCEGGGNPSTGAGNSGGSAGSGVCGAALCAELGSACGHFIDGCGEMVACNWCRYDSETIPDSSGQTLALAANPNTQILRVDNGNFVLSTKDAAWTTETVGKLPGSTVDLAQAADGAPWVFLGDNNIVQVGHKENGSWVIEQIGMSCIYGQIAIDADGVPHVGWLGEGPNGFAIYHSKRVGSSWTSEVVLNQAARGISFALSGNEVHFAYFKGDTKELVWAKPGANGFDTEIVRPSMGGDEFITSLVMDKDGTPHIAYIVGQAGSDPFEYATRKTGQWVTSVIGSNAPSGGEYMRLLLDPQGIPVVLHMGEEGLAVAEKQSVGWLVQGIVPHCSGSSAFDMAFDASGTLVIAHGCNSDLTILRKMGAPYAPDYLAACQNLSTTICNKADQCMGPLPCVNKSNGNYNCTASPVACTISLMDRICGDAAQDPTAIEPCQTDSQSTMCSMSSPGADLPLSCEAMF